MKIRLLALVTVVTLGLAACTGAPPPVSDVAKARWIEARTENFTVVTNGGEWRARHLVERLEDFRRFAVSMLGVEIESNPLPFTIYAVGSNAELESLIGFAGAFGAYQTSYRGGLSVVNINARGDDGTESLSVTYTRRGPVYRVQSNQESIGLFGVFHEYVHYLQAIDQGRRYPLWYSEGLAEYLSTFKVGQDGNYRVGLPAMHRVSELERGVPGPVSRSTVDSRFRWIPYAAVLNARGYDTGHGTGMLHSQSWLLAHYLMTKPERQAQLEAFLDALERPNPDAAAIFEEVFGFPTTQLDTRMKSYNRSRNFKSVKHARSDEPLPEPLVSVVAPDDIRARLAYTLTHFVGASEQVEQLLRDLLALNPTNLRALALQASIAYSKSDHATTQSIIDTVGEAGDADPEFLTLKGVLALGRAAKLAEADDISWVPEVKLARQHLTAAIELNPSAAEAKLILGRSYLLEESPPPDIAVRSVEDAGRLLPSSVEANLLLGHLHFRRGEVGLAQKNYELVIAWSRNPDARKRARIMVERIQGILADISQESANPSP